MVVWKHKLNLKDLFRLYKSKEIDLNEFSNKIADVIERSHFFSRYSDELENIVEEFRDLTNDDGVNMFDGILASLYDWADGSERNTMTESGPKITKTCWIDT